MDTPRIDYTPTTTAGWGALEAANKVLHDLTQGDLLARVPLPPALGFARSMLEPFAVQVIANKSRDLVAAVDADPDAARAAVLPALRRVVSALGIQAADLYDAPASLTSALKVAGDDA
ncbi:MAG: hypothetical protein M0R73_02655 [Dehalococcoidia bacterium]|nr:hypothetical protein [Dehalococcoidia bacterium]